MSTKLERWISLGLYILVALMPVHAFISVWLGHTLGHQAVIQAWKEVLLLVLAALAAALVWQEPKRLERLRQPWVMFAAAFAGLALLVTLFTQPDPLAVAFGIKTDLEFLLAAALAALVATPAFIKRLTIIILAGAAVVIGFGLAQVYLLPPDFLTHFGYGPDTIVPYEHITQGINTLRFPSTLGGPNQLGTYLILPLCLSLALAIKSRRLWPLAMFVGGMLVLVSTYSRSAWIGALLAIAITLLAVLPVRHRKRAGYALAVLLVAGLALLPLAISNRTLQYYVLHSSAETHNAAHTSDSDHATSLRDGLDAVVHAPLGHGLGTAGPATFHAGTGNIIEDNYLQIGYETGILGALLFIAVVATLIMRLAGPTPRPLLSAPTAAGLLGISIVALVLPAWTDSSTALIAWTAAGALSVREATGKHV